TSDAVAAAAAPPPPPPLLVYNPLSRPRCRRHGNEVQQKGSINWYRGEQSHGSSRTFHVNRRIEESADAASQYGRKFVTSRRTFRVSTASLQPTVMTAPAAAAAILSSKIGELRRAHRVVEESSRRGRPCA
ncbi:hypothetical protein ACHAWF_007338, partial [Thalassiosira exigua]